VNGLVSKMLDSYYGYRKNQSQTKELLSSKLMLFVADSIDRNVSNSHFNNLNLVKIILTKTYRRFPKETLHRLLIFYNSKTELVEN